MSVHLLENFVAGFAPQRCHNSGKWSNRHTSSVKTVTQSHIPGATMVHCLHEVGCAVVLLAKRHTLRTSDQLNHISHVPQMHQLGEPSNIPLSTQWSAVSLRYRHYSQSVLDYVPKHITWSQPSNTTTCTQYPTIWGHSASMSLWGWSYCTYCSHNNTHDPKLQLNLVSYVAQMHQLGQPTSTTVFTQYPTVLGPHCLNVSVRLIVLMDAHTTKGVTRELVCDSDCTVMPLRVDELVEFSRSFWFT